MKPFVVVVAAHAVLVVSGARGAGAQTFVSPFVDTTLSSPSTTGSSTKPGFGVAFGNVGKIVGVETEIAYYPQVIDNTTNALAKNRVFTFSGNTLIGPTIGRVKPYAAIGVGDLYLNVTRLSSLVIPNPATISTNYFTVNAGGGVMGFFTTQLMPLVYGELRAIAGRYLSRERADHTLQSTSLVHEAYFRLIDQRRVQWQNRAHFLGIAAQMMRRILVDHARTAHRRKRGGVLPALSLDAAMEASTPAREIDLLALDEALDRLAVIDPQQSRLVELRFFSGLTIEEAAIALGTSPGTVKREWTTARAWLFREMNRATP